MFAYIYIGAFCVDKPGLNYDEANFIPWLIERNDPFSLAEFWEDGPVSMLTGKLGALKSFLFMPIFSVLGVSYATIRIPSLVIGALALLLFYILSKRHLPEPLPLLVLILCALDPSMIFHVKTDWGPVALSLLLKMSILLLISNYILRKKTGALYFAAFLSGLGIWNDMGFFLFLFALGLGFWIAYRPLVLGNGRAILKVIICFLCGALPLILFNLGTGFFSIRTFEFASPVFSFGMLLNRLFLCLDTLCGVYPFFEYFDGKVGARYTIWPYALVSFAVISVLLRIKIGRPVFADKFLLATTWTFVVMLILLLFLPNSHGSQHFFSLTGLAQLILVSLVFFVYENTIKGSAEKKASWVLLVAPLLITAVIACAMYNVQLGKKGGENEWTTAIDKVAAYSKDEKYKTLVALDWGLALPVYVLSQGRAIMAQPCYKLAYPETSNQAKKDLSKSIDQGGTLFFARPIDRLTLIKPLETFSELMIQKRRAACIVATFENPSGMVEVYAMETGPVP